MKGLKNILILLVLLVACNNDVAKSFEPKNTALGKMNEIVVIADEDLWQGMVKDSFTYYFGSAFPILPAPEPMFDIRHFTTEEIMAEPLRRELRTYAILADLSDENSATTKMVKRDLGETKTKEAMTQRAINSTIGKNKWANGQQLIYFFGQNETNLSSSFRNNFAAAAKRINDHDFNQLKSSVYARGLHLGHGATLKQKYAIDIEIPAGYVIAKEETKNNLTWLRRDTDDATFNIVFQSFKYTNEAQLKKPQIITLRNEFGKEYVTTSQPNAYMVVNDEDLPVFEYFTKIDDRYTVEVRGIWETVNDFFGGAFITYMILDEKNSQILYADVFTYAPGKEKRNLMQQMDIIIKSITFPSSL